jgi:hypothetical protein
MKSILILFLLVLDLPINEAAKSANHTNKFYRGASFFLREIQGEECAASSTKRACCETSYLRDL